MTVVSAPRALCAAVILLAGCEATREASTGEARPAPVDAERIVAASDDEWLSHGRTYDEQRFSPLSDIDTDNVHRLGLAWYADLPTRRGIEATPIVADGVLYTTASWSMVFAYDAASGRERWRYDPQVPRVTAGKACCDAVNRGVALWGDHVFVGTLDGRLVALNKDTGEVAWEQLTVDPNRNYTITGAPRVAEGLVLIGNGGADMGVVRGYVSAYDAQTGELRWRFFTVPGNPADGFENPAMEMAAATWTGEWWKHGGGGTAWDAIVYDPELRLVYIGVGNGAPWNQRIRSPGGGDNLFLSSIVAVRADTGEYVWHYQTTPGEVWDYTATQPIVLADLEIDGVTRKVLMQAPKNGFFYVIDRETGDFISAKPYANVTWASEIDEAGRPVEAANARYPGDDVQFLEPGPGGAHNWHPMSYSPTTGLVYIPVIPSAFGYQNVPPHHRRPGTVVMGVDYSAFGPPESLADADMPAFPAGYLSAWDPVAQRERWRVEHVASWNGGTLATAGNLVFQGTADGTFKAFAADTGRELWSSPTYTGVMAGPITYRIDGIQYVAVMAGWGGVLAIHATPFLKGIAKDNHSRVLVYRLDGDDALPVPEETPSREMPEPPPMTLSEDRVTQGKQLFDRYCQYCHGAGAIAGGLVSDLRYSSHAVHDAWTDIVLKGQLVAAGMPAFSDYLSDDEAQAIRAYVIARASAERARRASH